MFDKIKEIRDNLSKISGIVHTPKYNFNSDPEKLTLLEHKTFILIDDLLNMVKRPSGKKVYWSDNSVVVILPRSSIGVSPIIVEEVSNPDSANSDYVSVLKDSLSNLVNEFECSTGVTVSTIKFTEDEIKVKFNIA